MPMTPSMEIQKRKKKALFFISSYAEVNGVKVDVRDNGGRILGFKCDRVLSLFLRQKRSPNAELQLAARMVQRVRGESFFYGCQRVARSVVLA